MNNWGIFLVHRGTQNKDWKNPSHPSPLLKACGMQFSSWLISVEEDYLCYA